MKSVKNMDLDMSQMSLKFCEIQDFMTSVIIGATTMEQLKTNIESVNINYLMMSLKKLMKFKQFILTHVHN